MATGLFVTFSSLIFIFKSWSPRKGNQSGFSFSVSYRGLLFQLFRQTWNKRFLRGWSTQRDTYTDRQNYIQPIFLVFRNFITFSRMKSMNDSLSTEMMSIMKLWSDVPSLKKMKVVKGCRQLVQVYSITFQRDNAGFCSSHQETREKGARVQVVFRRWKESSESKQCFGREEVVHQIFSFSFDHHSCFVRWHTSPCFIRISCLLSVQI